MVTIFNLNGRQCQDNIPLLAHNVADNENVTGGLYAYNCERGAAVRSDARSGGTWVRTWFVGGCLRPADLDVVGAVPAAAGAAGARGRGAQGYRPVSCRCDARMRQAVLAGLRAGASMQIAMYQVDAFTDQLF